MIKLQKSDALRTFLASFFITLILSGLFLGIHWVSINAQRGGFDAPSPIAAEYEGQKLTFSLMGNKYEIDLAPLNRAAEKIQRFEGWIVPEKMRFFSRFSCYMADRMSTRERQQKEREFYKNAGLV